MKRGRVVNKGTIADCDSVTVPFFFAREVTAQKVIITKMKGEITVYDESIGGA